MFIRNNWALFLLMILFPFTLSAQQKINISGKVKGIYSVDQNENIIPNANIAIITTKDSSFVKGTTSDAKGAFHLHFIPEEKKHYLLKVSYAGMQSVYIRLNTQKTRILLNDIILKEGIELEEVTITAAFKVTEQIKDTTVINTAAYKVPEGAYLKDLIKRIPGLEYHAENNSLSYNGLPISEININGRTYFSGNKEIAIENLPADVVAKIKVYDKKSDIEKATGVRSEQENYVLDIQTKKAFDGTLMGFGEIGYGNRHKKNLQLLGNCFKQNGESATLIAKSTNSYMTTSYKDNIFNSVAANFGKFIMDNLTVEGHFMYNYENAGNESASYNEQYLTNQNKYTHAYNDYTNTNRMLTSSFNIHWDINSRTLLNVNGNFVSANGNNNTDNRQMIFNANPELNHQNPFDEILDSIPDDIKLNSNAMLTHSQSLQKQFFLNAGLVHQLNSKGTNISLNMQHTKGNINNRNINQSSITYYQLKNKLGDDSIFHQMQYYPTFIKNNKSSIGTRFTHPFSKLTRIQLSYNFNYSRQRNLRNTYDLSQMKEEPKSTLELPLEYETGYVDSLSNLGTSHTWGHETGIHIDYTGKDWNITSGISIEAEKRTIKQKTGSRKGDMTTHNINIQPTATIVWSKDRILLRLTYRGDTRQPLLSDLLSLTDNSNPLNIIHGNPNLKPAYNQTVRLEANNLLNDFTITANWQNEFNSPTRATIYNTKTGGSETYPLNINGNWNIDVLLGYQKRWGEFNVSAYSDILYARNVTYISEKKDGLLKRSRTDHLILDEKLRLSYLPEWGNIDFTGNFQYQSLNNLLQKNREYTRYYEFRIDAYTNLPKNILLNTDLTYSFRNGTNIVEERDNQLIWNINLTWKFLKQKQAAFSIYVADILNQRKQYIYDVSANGFSESYTKQIGRFFIVSFKYNFNFMQIKK